MSSTGGGDTHTLHIVRRVLGLLLLVAFVGTIAELLLLEHDEDASQLIPLVLLGIGAVALVITSVRPARRVITAFRTIMVLLIAGSVLGLALHFSANLEFQRELTPADPVSELMVRALSAKTPPALAPGVLAQLGCLGLIYAYRLPAGTTRRRRPEGDHDATID